MGRVLVAGSIVGLLLLVGRAEAAPVPHQVALDAKGERCGDFWGGDEHHSYDLPAGWTAYTLPIDGGKLVTPAGECRAATPRECCAQLQVAYAGDVGVSRSRSGAATTVALASFAAALGALIAAFLVVRRRRAFRAAG